MKKLFAQIVKFGIVGFISFGIDYVTGLIVLNLVMALTSSSYFEMASLVGSVAGFTVSVIANYILSFKFVFERKEDLNKKVEFITFVVLSPPRGWCIAFSEGSSPEGCDFPQSWSAPNQTGDATLPLRWLPPATLL